MPELTARLLLVAACATACTTVRPVQAGEYIPAHYPDVVWISYAENSDVAVDRPKVYGDTLHGTIAGGADSVVIPLEQVTSVRARMPDKTKTAFLVSATIVGGISAIYFFWVSKAGAGSSQVGPYCGVDPDGRAYQSC